MARKQPFHRKPRLRAELFTRLPQRLGQGARFFLLAFGLGLLALQQNGAVRGADELPAMFYHDFRGRPIPHELTLFNAEEGKFFRFEPEGLRITIPKTWIHPWGGIGFWTSFGFGGDFEVTTTCEILQADAPPSGYGVGVTLYVAKPAGGAGIGRLVRVNDKQLLLCNQAIEGPGKNTSWPEKGSPCTDTLLRLRLKRTGTTLHYLWAQGTAGEDFKEIDQCEFGDSEIHRIRLTAGTGRQPCNLDVRLIDLRVRSQTSDLPAASSLSPAGAPSKSRWQVWLVLALVLTLSVGLWLAVRQSRRARETSVRAVAPPEQGQPEATPLPISFACSGCGKTLKAKVELAGKKVKCPQCGQQVIVPQTEAGEAADGSL